MITNKVFKKGDKVALKDDDISGVVVAVMDKEVIVRTADGFDMSFANDLLVKEDTNSFLAEMSHVSIIDAKEWAAKYKSKPKLSKSRKQLTPPMEVDLHIQQLTHSIKGMTNHDMLTLQINTAKNRLEFAIQKKIAHIIFIHGVGEGVLREELIFLLGHYSGIEFFDAPYAKYGMGATQVSISPNAKRH
jgi:DNA-nicking Smr family endonuclease